jgi:hypothetical protein
VLTVHPFPCSLGSFYSVAGADRCVRCAEGRAAPNQVGRPAGLLRAELSWRGKCEWVLGSGNRKRKRNALGDSWQATCSVRHAAQRATYTCHA